MARMINWTQKVFFYSCILALLLTEGLAFKQPHSEDRTSLRDRLQRNAKIPPVSQDGHPLGVKAGIFIESLGKFQATEMSFDVDLYLYLSWRDPSLNHTNPDYVLVNDPKVRQHIWLPDLYFSNARNSKFHEVTVPNFNLFIAQDGTIAYSSRITLNVACNLNLVHYPMDRQTCAIRTLSYAYVENQVNITWFNDFEAMKPIRYNSEIGLPEFQILRISADYCDGTYLYAITENTYKTDKFSCLEANIHLRRSIGYHLVQSFIPTGLIVMISWVSFWIDRRAVPARVTLSFTTLLSLSTLGNGLRFGLPQVSYAKSIDFWFGSCMFFVFLSLVEFAAVNSYMRQSEKYEKLANSITKRRAVIPDSPAFSGGKTSPLTLFNRSGRLNGTVRISEENPYGGYDAGFTTQNMTVKCAMNDRYVRTPKAMSMTPPAVRTPRFPVTKNDFKRKIDHAELAKVNSKVHCGDPEKKESECWLPPPALPANNEPTTPSKLTFVDTVSGPEEECEWIDEENVIKDFFLF
ncbi:neurotransmitter-gated ion-channel ligand binding domain-containing protein [Ditylenchus destructor]|nr:neurotransmitter-gated ion-channel ligand binding domain-containing protein [Ditylenchus destructor]